MLIFRNHSLDTVNLKFYSIPTSMLTHKHKGQKKLLFSETFVSYWPTEQITLF